MEKSGGGGYNEPFSNKVIFERMKMARKAKIFNRFVINTNGDYISYDNIKEAQLSGLNLMKIQMYMDFEIQNIFHEKKKEKVGMD